MGAGAWAVVGLDRRGVERYRVSGYGSEDEARATLEFHPAGTVLTYSVRFEGESWQAAGLDEAGVVPGVTGEIPPARKARAA